MSHEHAKLERAGAEEGEAEDHVACPFGCDRAIARRAAGAHAGVCPSFGGWRCRFCGLRGLMRDELVAHAGNQHMQELVWAAGIAEGAATASEAEPEPAAEEDPAAANAKGLLGLTPFYVTYRHWESTTNKDAPHLGDGYGHSVPGDPRNRGWHSFCFYAPVSLVEGSAPVSGLSARAPFYAWDRRENVPSIAGYRPLEICINATRDGRKFYWSQYWKEEWRTGEYYGWHTTRVIWVLAREA